MAHPTLLFTDLVDSTALVERVGDTRAAELWAEHDRRARALLAQHPGREIDRTDGFFLLFDAVHDAAQYAVAYHLAMSDLSLSARVGLHVGTVTLRDNDPADVARGAKPLEVEGLAKPFAARIMSLACGGQTLLSAAARAALGESLPTGTVIDSHGHYRLKGIEEPVEIFELGTQAGAFAPPVDVDKAYRVLRSGELWRPLREVRHNLAPERDAFVGRSAELRRLALAFEGGARLLTLLGPGGSGKTRLIRRYALGWLGDWPGGAYFCDLSEARTPDGVHFAVAGALGVPLGRDDPARQLAQAMAGRGQCLVIFDNAEQVLAAVSALLEAALAHAPNAAFAVTSRERLQSHGEQIFSVEPLAVESEAVDLFEVRARAHQPTFSAAGAQRAAVLEAVRLLDGLPLAIELAAARVRVLSPAQIVERLRDRFALLIGARGVESRQATLRAAIDWSWTLLNEWEQAALAQCSVFDGGFTLEAAEAVLDLRRWSDAPAVLDAVQSLVDKSLLRAWWPRAGAARLDLAEPHFGMYLSIHDYAGEKLAAEGGLSRDAAQVRHGRCFARHGGDAAIEALYGPQGLALRQALALEAENLATGCKRAAARGDAEVAVYTCRALWEVLELRGPFTTGVTLANLAAAIVPLPTALAANVQQVLAMALQRAGRPAEAEAAYALALPLAREAGDRFREASVLVNLGILEMERARNDSAESCYTQSLALARALGHRRAEGNVLGNLGAVHMNRGATEQARAHYEASLALHVDVGNLRDEAIVLSNLGTVARAQGRHADAQRCYERALELNLRLGNLRFQGIVNNNLGGILGRQGRLAEARERYVAALALIREVGNRSLEGAVLSNLGTVDTELGRLEEAAGEIAAAKLIARELDERGREAQALNSEGELHAVRGNNAAACELHAQALAIARERGLQPVMCQALRGLAQARLRLGEGVQAQADADEGEALLRQVGDKVEIARLNCVQAELHARAGRTDEAAQALAAAEADTTDFGPQSLVRREIERARQIVAAAG